MSAGEQDGKEPATQPALIDLVLGSGTPEELAQLRARVAADPFAAIEFAEARQLIEEFRELRVLPSPEFAPAMDAVVQRAIRWQSLRRAPLPLSRRLLPYLASAAMLLASLALLDPLRLGHPRPDREPDLPQVNFSTRIAMASPSAPVRLRRPEALAVMLAAGERLGGGVLLQEALQRFQNLSTSERMSPWLQATSAVAAQRERFEARVAVDVRRKALDSHNATLVDERIQTLAHDLGSDLRSPDALPVATIAMAVRALVAAGNASAVPDELWLGADRIAAVLPDCRGGELATALLALAECAAVTGRHAMLIQEHGERLLREVLECDGDFWSSRLPAWINGRVATAQCADAGRFLAIAPAFGLDGESCILVRLLLAAHLQQRRMVQKETPELLAALLHGFGDVLLKSDLRELEVRLSAWRWSSLEPQFTTLQQLFWCLVPSSSGYAQFRREAERVEALPTPDSLGDRAAFCLALSAGYAGGAVRGVVRPGF